MQKLGSIVGRVGLAGSLSAMALAAALTTSPVASAFAAGATPPAQTPATASQSVHHRWRHHWPLFVQGRPTQFHAGAASGLYVWHDLHGPSRWHVEVTDPQGTNSEYTGTLRTDGAFVDLISVQPEKDDYIAQDGKGIIRFKFHTYAGIDGVRFAVAGGRHLRMHLSINGTPAPTSEIVIGHGNHNPKQNPFTFTRERSPKPF